jgi:hypothetical protein
VFRLGIFNRGLSFSILRATTSTSTPVGSTTSRLVTILAKTVADRRILEPVRVFEISISGLPLEKGKIKFLLEDVLVLISDMLVDKLTSSESLAAHITLKLLVVDLLAFFNTELVFHFIQDYIL